VIREFAIELKGWGIEMNRSLRCTGWALLACAAPLAAGCSQHSAVPVAINVNGVKNTTSDGRVYVAGAPTDDGLREMKRLGVTTIVDVRGEADAVAHEKAIAQSLGLHYINIPMKSDALTAEQADAISREMQKHDGEKVLLHCAGGNRAGAAYGAWLGKSGRCPIDDTMIRAEKAGMSNASLKEDLRRRLTDPAGK
jgi:protein tyrosine phosphatase (PTP) superfamily phosphohydrolase (DUF442 family)